MDAQHNGHINDEQPDLDNMVNLDQKALEQAREKQKRAELVNLGMVKVSPGFATTMNENYQAYLNNLTEGQEKLYKTEYYGSVMEKAFNVSQEALISDLAKITTYGGRMLQLSKDAQKAEEQLKKAEETLNQAEKLRQKTWLIFIAFMMIAAFIIFLFYQINRKKDE